MKKGDRIRCIESRSDLYITLGKLYVVNEIIEGCYKYYRIYNDVGINECYVTRRFINISEDRRNKLEKLNAI